MPDATVEIFLRARENVTQAFRNINAATQRTQRNLQTLERSSDATRLTTNIDRLRRRAADAGISIERLNLETSELDRLTLRRTIASVRQYGRELQRAEAQAERLRNTANDLAQRGRRQLTAGVIAGGISAAAVRQAGQFSLQIAEVGTLVDDATLSNEQLGDEVLRVSNLYGRGTQDVASGLYTAISAGAQAGAEANNLLDVAIRTAIGGVTQTNSAVSGIATTINAFNLGFDQAEDVADALFTTMRGGQTTVEELSNFLFQAAPIANTLGVSFDGLLATVQALTLSGVPTAQAFTQVRAALNGLTRDTPEQIELWRRLNVENVQQLIAQEGLIGAFQAVNNAVDGNVGRLTRLIGSTEGVSAALLVSGTNAERAEGALESLQNRAGALASAEAEVQNTLGGTLNRLTTSFANLFTAIGTATGETLEPFLMTLTDGAIAIAAFIETNGELVGALAGVTAGVVAFTVALGALNLLLGATILPAIASFTVRIATMRLGLATLGGATAVATRGLAALRLAATLALGPWGALIAALGAAAFALNRFLRGTAAVPQLENLTQGVADLNTEIGSFSLERVEREMESLGATADILQVRLAAAQERLRLLQEIRTDAGEGFFGFARGAIAGLAIDDDIAAARAERDDFLRQQNLLIDTLARLEARRDEIRNGGPLLPETPADTPVNAPSQVDEAALREAQQSRDRLAAALRAGRTQDFIAEQNLERGQRRDQLEALERSLRDELITREEFNARRIELINEDFNAQEDLVTRRRSDIAEAARIQIDRTPEGTEREALNQELANETARAIAELRTLEQARARALSAFADESRAAAAQDLRDTFNEILEERDRLLNNISNRRANLTITQVEAEREAIVVTNEANEQLRQLVETARQLAETTGDNSLLRLAEDAAAATTRVSEEMSALGQQVSTDVQGNLTNFFETLGDSATTADEKVAAFADGVIQSLTRIAAQQLALRVVTGIGGVAAAATGGQVQAATGGQVQAFARGGPVGPARGFIKGPGTGTSDSIAARLSNGEYVIKARSVKHYGAQLFEQLNRQALPRIPLAGNFPITRPRVGRFMTGGQAQQLAAADTLAREQGTERPIEINAPITIQAQNLEGFNRSRGAIQADMERRLKQSARRFD